MFVVGMVWLSEVAIEFHRNDGFAQPKSLPDIIYMTNTGRSIANFGALILELCWADTQLTRFDLFLTQFIQLHFKLGTLGASRRLIYDVLADVCVRYNRETE